MTKGTISLPTRFRTGRSAAAVALAAALAVTALVPTAGHAATTAESLSVNLASTTGAPTGVGEGFLYGLSQDGSSPADNYLQPLGPTLMRGGGARIAGDGWIGDGYTDGSGFQARINSALAQAKRMTQSPYHAEYVLMLSDLWGADLTQTSSALYPCNNNDCSNWITFIQDVVAAVKAAGVTVTYEPYNEPNGTNFFAPGIGTQYWEMWNSAVKEIRSLDSSAKIDGPAYAGASNSAYASWLTTAKADGTLPNVFSFHLEGGGQDDPVLAAQEVQADMTADGITGVTLSANEFLPQNQENAALNAWYLDRFAQSTFATAARGEWDNCCASGDEGTILTSSGGDLIPSGQWWAYRAYADLTGQLVSTTGTSTTAVTASVDSSKARAVALIADDSGYEGPISLAISGFGSAAYLASGGVTHVEVDRIHDQSEWSSPQTVFSANETVSNGQITVPFEGAGANDAYVVYVTAPGSVTADTTTDDATTSGTDHFAYSGTWGTATGISDLYSGTAHWSTTTGSSATYTFTGSQVAIHGVKDVDQGIAGISVDGGPVTYVDDYSPSRQAQATLWSSYGLSSGTHTVTITPTGTKNSSSSNDIIALDDAVVNGTSVGTTAIDDGTTSGTDHFTYGSNWGTATGVSDLYDGTAHWNSTAASTATFTFTGTGATIYGVKDVDQGIATYSVDGGTARSVDDYAKTRVAGAGLFTVSGLSQGTHTITITVTGTKNTSSSNDIVALDYALVS
ncbi:MAG TPA: hypothetical protein VL551_19200 [Actinospica sp.]|nr:hypothetical protein [Actinospica sp.]